MTRYSPSLRSLQAVQAVRVGHLAAMAAQRLHEGPLPLYTLQPQNIAATCSHLAMRRRRSHRRQQGLTAQTAGAP